MYARTTNLIPGFCWGVHAQYKYPKGYFTLQSGGVERMDKEGSGLVLPKLIPIRIKGFPRITNGPYTASVFVCGCVCLTEWMSGIPIAAC